MSGEEFLNNPDNLIDLWIMDKFSVLPTDERFINLYEEQKLSLYMGLCSLPEQKNIKRNYIYSKKRKEIENKPDEAYMNAGLKKYKEICIRDGATEEQANQSIKEVIDRNRQKELDDLEGLMNG